MKKSKSFIIDIILIVTIIIIILWLNLVEHKKLAIRNLKTIEWELMDCYNYYVRNANKVDYSEIRQAIKHLDIAIYNYQDFRVTLVKTNSEKIINAIDKDFQKIASSNIISSENAELFFKKIFKLRNIINDSLKNAKLNDVSNDSYISILNILEDIDHQLFEY